MEKEKKEWYQNGNLKAVDTYNNSDGFHHMTYYEDGSKEHEGDYMPIPQEVFDKMDFQYPGFFNGFWKIGEWKTWDGAGQVTSIENYNAQGQQHGTQRSWDKTTQGLLYLHTVEDFNNGVRKHIIWYDSKGIIISEGK
jgi:antitoxin component YwqK of YwqJK toxin-antitoxin module